MKIPEKAIETSLKMTGTSGIVAFTLFGIVAYLFVFLGIAFSSERSMDTQRILSGGILGAVFIAVIIVSTLRISRYFLLKLSKSKPDV